MTAMGRRLGLGDSVFLVIGAVFGSGIFLTTGIVAARLPSPGLIWIIWMIGGLITMAGALCYGELGSMFPRSGGPYIYLRAALGPAAAFAFGWTFFWIIGGAGVAALAVGFAEYVIGLLGFGSRPVIAVVSIVLLTLFNLRGIGLGARIQSALTIVRIAAVGALVAAAAVFAAKSGLGNAFPLWPAAGAKPSLTALGWALLVVFWAYDGWYSVNCAAEEIKNPRRTIPLALILGTGGLLVLYSAANIVYSIALPIKEMSGVIRIGEAAASRLFGSAGTAFTGVIALAVLGCLSANILFCARIPFAMARDGAFLKPLGRVDRITGAPVYALTAQMIWASFLCLTGSYGRLIEFVMFAGVLFYAATGISVIVLRRKRPTAERPYRVPAYPALPIAYALINLIIAGALAVDRPFDALAGLGIIFLGLPAYLLWKRGNSCPRE
jgi:APA family basic amino acid/polyamine antiporter